MACAVFAYGNTRVGGSYFDIKMRIPDGVADLLESASCNSTSIDAMEYLLAGFFSTSSRTPTGANTPVGFLFL